LAGQLLEQGLMIPGGGADEVLQPLAVEVVAVGDRLGVLVLQVGDEAGEGDPGMVPLLVADQAGGERLDEVSEAFDEAIESLGAELAFGEQLLLAEFEASLHRSTSQEKALSLEGCSTKQLGYSQRSPTAEIEIRESRARSWTTRLTLIWEIPDKSIFVIVQASCIPKEATYPRSP
jgi:hypothetical protein